MITNASVDEYSQSEQKAAAVGLAQTCGGLRAKRILARGSNCAHGVPAEYLGYDCAPPVRARYEPWRALRCYARFGKLGSQAIASRRTRRAAGIDSSNRE